MPTINRPSRDLAQTDDFVSRHIGPRNTQLSKMPSEIGLSSMDALIEKAVPAAIFDGSPIDLPESRTEADVLAELLQLAKANKPMKSLIGMGYYDCITPPVVLRNVLENPGWYTAYTPYQPEISQGRLEALLNFQTMVADLTGMEIANASLLDEGTAAAKAMTMCRRVGKLKSDKFFVAADCHPQTIAVLKTRAEPLGIELVIGNPFSDLDTAEVYAALLQYPATDGSIQDYRQISASLKEAGAMLVVATDLLALTLLTPPGEWGRTSLSAVRSVLVCRWASVGRTRRFSRRRMHINVRCRVVWSAFPSMRAADRRSGSRCRLESNIFAARKRPAASVRRRSYW